MGGIERVVASLAVGLVGRGHDVTLLGSGGSRSAGAALCDRIHLPTISGDQATVLPSAYASSP